MQKKPLCVIRQQWLHALGKATIVCVPVAQTFWVLAAAVLYSQATPRNTNYTKRAFEACPAHKPCVSRSSEGHEETHCLLCCLLWEHVVSALVHSSGSTMYLLSHLQLLALHFRNQRSRGSVLCAVFLGCIGDLIGGLTGRPRQFRTRLKVMLCVCIWFCRVLVPVLVGSSTSIRAGWLVGTLDDRGKFSKSICIKPGRSWTGCKVIASRPNHTMVVSEVAVVLGVLYLPYWNHEQWTSTVYIIFKDLIIWKPTKSRTFWHPSIHCIKVRSFEVQWMYH